MQKRPREQRGSIEPTQIARRRLERCLALGRPLLPPRGWPSRHAVHCQSPRCGRAECRGVARDMQERPREQCGSIGPTQIVRRRRERCLGLPHPHTLRPVSGRRGVWPRTAGSLLPNPAFASHECRQRTRVCHAAAPAPLGSRERASRCCAHRWGGALPPNFCNGQGLRHPISPTRPLRLTSATSAPASMLCMHLGARWVPHAGWGPHHTFFREGSGFGQPRSAASYKE
jgi:hypothetical protein